jgi:hypothetical protein
MVEGFYAMYYTGEHGSGSGLLAFVAGNVVGVDVVGGRLDGSYTVDEAAHKLTGVIRMNVPANALLVTGQQPRAQPYTIDLPVSVPSDLGAGKPIRLNLPIGPLNIRFDKLRDLPDNLLSK